jgi:hypothetical protein
MLLQSYLGIDFLISATISGSTAGTSGDAIMHRRHGCMHGDAPQALQHAWICTALT